MLVSVPMAAPDRVLVVLAMSIGAANPAVLDFCHLCIVPLWPFKVKLLGVLPLQMVWVAAVMLPPTGPGFRVSLGSRAVV